MCVPNSTGGWKNSRQADFHARCHTSHMSRRFDPAEPELMDIAERADDELARDLENLVSLNRRFGSHRLTRKFLNRWLAPGRCFRVLDLCTGAGDLPRMMVQWARRRDITLRVDALDANAATLELARRSSVNFPEIEFICGDVLRWEPAGRYDFVHCSLALHHFSDENAVRVLKCCREWSNHWVLATDLERHPATTVGVWLLTALWYRDAMTVHDARISAQRAFSFGEMGELANAAGWPAFGHARFLLCRQALWLEGRDLGEVPLDAVELPSPA
jgi:SAM-dependent methyltransferase